MAALPHRTVLNAVFTVILLTSHASVFAACEQPAWNPEIAYERGSIVSHINHEWRAKRNVTVGVAPGSHKPSWADRGACDTGDSEPPPPTTKTEIQIFGVWHAGNHYADWSVERDMAEFDTANRWLIDRNYDPDLPLPALDDVPVNQGAVNLVILSFLQPMDVLNMDESNAASGVPLGMTQEIVDYFKDVGIRVMMSIGGVTYTDFWDQALAIDADELGRNAAFIAQAFGVGIEIDYERGTNPNLVGLQGFVDAYRDELPYDASGLNPAARLTIDLAAGGRYLQDLNRYATVNWLDNENPVLDYANAMVHRASGTPSHWQEHIDGMPTYDPVIPPKAPNRFTGGLYLKGNMDNCTDFSGSEQNKHSDYVQTIISPIAGASPGMLGYMFWAAEYPSARRNYTATVPPNTCEDGMGVSATTFGFAIPMEPLRQQ